MRRNWTLACAAIALLVAGCAEEPASNLATESPSTTAPVPEPDAATGSISGLVHDEESLPIKGVTVALIETESVVETDAAGQFTLNGLQPGTFGLVFERLGFETRSQKVVVEAGQVAEVKVLLKSIVLAPEPYHVSQPRTAMIHVGVTSVVTLLNESAVNSFACDPCRFPIHFDPNPVAMLSEGKWTATGTPINSGLNLHHYKNWNGGSSGQEMCHMQPNAQPYKRPWSEACVSNAQKIDKLLLTVQPGPIPGTVAVENRVETWTTFAYVDPLPEDFSVFPS